MKRTVIIIITINILCLNTSVFAQLKQTDLDKINELILASEKRMKEYMDLKIDALDKKLTGEINTVKEETKGVKGSVSMLYGFVIALVALITIAVGIPQFLLARRGKEMETYLERIETLSRELEALKQQRIVGPS